MSWDYCSFIPDLPSITSYDAISLFDFPQVFSMPLPAILILHNQLFAI